MKKHALLIGVLGTIVVGSFPASAVHAADSLDHIVITKLQPATTHDASSELIEIYNPTNEPIEMTGWQIEYRSAGADEHTKWTAKSKFACPGAATCQNLLPAKSTFLLASYNVADKTHDLASGMASTGGQVRLIDGAGLQIDMIGYGAAKSFERNPAAAPKSNEVLRRLQDGVGFYVDTDNNAEDFVAIRQDETTEPDQVSTELPITYPQLLITELLPNPAAPEEDATSEFIELYNPGTETVDARGYTLQAGSDWRYKYELPSIRIEPGDYVAFRSAQTNIALSNSGGAVRLLDPTDHVIDETARYGVAKDGQSWMRANDGVWWWTQASTPGAPNILLAPAALTIPKTTSAPKAKKTSAAKKTSTAKPKTNTKKAVKGAKQTTANTTPASASQPPQLSYWLLGGAAVLVVGYIVYEYRVEIWRKLQAIRAYLPGK